MSNGKGMRVNVSRMLTLSSKHISERTATLLLQNGETGHLPVSVYPKADFGLFMYFSASALFDESIPADLMSCLRVAKESACSVLCLDADEPPLPALTTFGWDGSTESIKRRDVVQCKRSGSEVLTRVRFEELKAGDTVFVDAHPRVLGSDAHFSGDASYNGFLIYDEKGDSLFPEDLD